MRWERSNEKCSGSIQDVTFTDALKGNVGFAKTQRSPFRALSILTRNFVDIVACETEVPRGRQSITVD
jgi:hypothetical protein